jgi:hypothetical protein
MADAFSVTDRNAYVGVVEEAGTGHVTVNITTLEDTLSVTVEAGDLARALITASPTFTTGVGELTQKAILEYLSESEESSVGK